MVQTPKLLWNQPSLVKEERLQKRGNRRLKIHRLVAFSVLFCLLLIGMGFQDAHATPIQVPYRALVSGLQGEYFDNPNLQLPMVLSRIDNTVDFLWAYDPPDVSLPPDGFSVRWSGQVQAQFSETYTFHTFSDDGVRLWVNGQLLIDNWTIHGTAEDTGSVALQAGGWYDIRLEYFEGGGEARMILEWSSPSTSKAVIPESVLRYPDTGHINRTCSDTAAIADGASPIYIDVEVLDEADNPIPDLPVSIQISGEFNAVKGIEALPSEWSSLGLTESDGVINGTLTSTLAEQKDILIKAGDVVLLPALECTFSPGALNKLQILLSGEQAAPGDEPGKMGNPDPLVRGQSTEVHVRAVDTYWNLVPSFNGEVILATSDTGAVLPSSTTLTGGESFFQATWNNEGVQTLSATVAAQPGINGERTLEILSNRIPGLLGTYYNNLNLEPPVAATRYDSQVDFFWPGSPMLGVNADNFSVVWHGVVKPLYSETYTFYTLSDDGIRLWIDDQLVIDNWTFHSSAENSGQVDLQAGVPVDVRLAFFEGSGDAVVRLEWSSPSTPRTAIPTERLTYLDLSGTDLSFDPITPQADGIATTALTIELANAIGDPFVNTPVTIKIEGEHTAVNGTSIASGEWREIGVTDVNGEVTADISSTQAGSKAISIRAEGQILDTSASVEFLPGAASQLVMLFPGETHAPGAAPGKSGIPEPIEATRAVEVTLLAVDDSWNLASFTGPIILETDPGSASHPDIVFLENGSTSFLITWNEVGPSSLTASNPATGFESMTTTEAVDVQPRSVLTVGDGETLFVDEARYVLSLFAKAGDPWVPYYSMPGFGVGDEILIMNVLGDGMGTHEVRTIAVVLPDHLLLDAPLENDYGGFSAKAIVQKVPYFGDVVVENGGTISAHPWDGDTGGIVFFRAENLTIEAGGIIDATALGFRSGEGPGSGGYVAGGGYGGYGGDDPGGAQGGLGYGLATAPMYLGSAGGDASATENTDRASGGSGGGIVRLDIAATLINDGSIFSAGSMRWGYIPDAIGGGGSGGSIWIEANSLQGNGRLEARGGDSYLIRTFDDPFVYRGSGAGGRISIQSGTNEFTGTIVAVGRGDSAGPGTIYLRDAGTGETQLRVDNFNRSTKPALLTAPESTPWFFDTIELIRNGDLEIPNPDDFLLFSPGNMAGDGTGQLHLHSDLVYPYASLRHFGFYMAEGTSLRLSGGFTVQGTELSIHGALEGISDILLAPDGDADATLTLGARGGTVGDPQGLYTLNTILIEPDQTLALEGDPLSGLGVTINTVQVEIQSNGHLSADGLGYQPGGLLGPGTSAVNASAGHGGYGGSEYGGTPYGNAIAPVTLGSASSGAGGGALHLISDELILEGMLSANGDPAPRSGGAGAGGSLWLEVGSLSGGGVLQANGGERYPFGADTSGGGGRISLTTETSTFSGTIEAVGGAGVRVGGPGTVVLTDLAAGQRSLVIDNQDQDGSKAGLTDPEPTDWLFDRIELIREGNLELMDPDDTLPLTTAEIIGDATAQITLHGSVTYAPLELDSFGFVVAPDGHLTLASDLTLRGTELSVEGELTGGERMTVTAGSGHSGRLDLAATGYHTGEVIHGTFVFETLTLEQGQVLGIQGDPESGRGVTIYADQMTVAYEAVVDADGTGYPYYEGPGKGSAAGHGGYGGGPNGGTAYGSVYSPIELGSGGLAPGGGALHVVGGDLVVDGTISANGLRSGGAGGSVWLDVDFLTGFGTIRANGGSGFHNKEDGGGAGGRIAIHFNQNGFKGTLDAHSYPNQYHNYPGGAGTIYFHSKANGEQSLLVDNAGYEGEQAVLADPGTTVWEFDRIELIGGGDLGTLNPSDTVTLSLENMAGDGSAQFYLYDDYSITLPEIHGFGFHVPEETTLTLPQDFTVKGVPLTVLGMIAGVENLTLIPDVSSIADVRFGPQASTLAMDPRNFSFIELNIENGARMELAGDPILGAGAVINTGELTVGGHLTADELGYTYPEKGPGAPTDFSGGAGHGGAGGDPGGGITYGSMTEPETLGSAGFSEYHGNGGGAIRIIAGGTVTVTESGRISADAGNFESGAENGAGGSIWIQADAVLGSGTIAARGGRGAWGGDGGGGGGRIAVYATEVDPALTFDVDTTFPSQGGPGTIYFGGVDPLQSTIEITPAEVPTDGFSTATALVTLRDGGGNPLPGQPVEVGLDVGRPIFIDGQSVQIGGFVSIGITDANGEATGSLYTEAAGSRTLRARSGQVLLTQSASVEFVPGPVDPTLSTIWGTPAIAPADGLTLVSVWVKALDEFENEISGLTVELFSTGSAAVTQPVDLTAANGITSGSLTHDVIETVMVSAEIDGVAIDDVFEVEFTGADLDLRLTGPEVTAPGAIYTYQIDLRNSGELIAEEVTLIQTLPPEVIFEFQNAPVEPNRDGNQLTWLLDDLAVDERVLFNVGVEIPGDTPYEAVLETSVNVTTSSTEPDQSNNSATHRLQVVDGNEHSVALVPQAKTIALGAEGSFKVIVENTGLLGDSFTLDLTGLESTWYSFESEEVGLSPGGTAEVELQISVADCGSTGEYPFSIRAVSAATGGVESASGMLTLQLEPVFSAFQPQNGTELGSPDVALQWKTDVPSTGSVTLYPLGQPASSQVFNTLEGTDHSLVVEGLTRDTTYVWQVEATSACDGVGLSPERQFTVTNGVIFSQREVDVTIDRDYDQRFSVTVVNTDVVAHAVKLNVQNPYEDLILNFIGRGSVDETVTLLPGEAHVVQMAVHAQDAELRQYQLTAVVQSDEPGDPIRDTATLDIRVLFDADFEVEEVSRDPVSEAVKYRVVNYGTTLTDLSVRAIDPGTGQPAQVFLSPSITHALLGTDGTVEFTVFPLFGPEDVAEPIVSTGAPGLFSVRRQGVRDFDLLVEAGGVLRNVFGTIDCLASGKQVHPLALDQVVLTCSAGDWYCTNRTDIDIPFPMPWFARPEVISGSSLAASFRPSSEALPHSVDLKFNSTYIGSPDDPIPQGTYRFDVPASAYRGTFEAGTIVQNLHLHSEHPNDAHYTIATGFKLQAALEGAMMYVCAASPEEAFQAASKVCDMSALASEMSVAITWPKDGLQFQPSTSGFVNIQANVFDDIDPFVDQYDAQATIEYLDPSAELIEDETILLFNDGLEGHGDLAAGDRFYNVMWKPQAGGSIRITVAAKGLAPGLEDSDAIMIDLNVLSDLSVERVWQNEVSLLHQQAQVHAEIKNEGFSVSGPIEIEFCYYDVREETGEPIGLPIYCSRFDALAEGETILSDELIEVVDTQFVAPRLGLFYVVVTVDPE